MHQRPVVLVVGGSGFIGRATLAALDPNRYEIHATFNEAAAVGMASPRAVGASAGAQSDVRTPAPDAAQLDPPAWHRLDLMDGVAVRSLIERLRPTHLLALAWRLSDRDHLTMVANRDWVRALSHLAEVFAQTGGERAVFAGTYAEYGVVEGTLDETTPPAPVSLYAKCKDELRQIVASHVPDSAWARMFTVYGPHDAPYRLVPSVIESLLAGREVRTTEGKQVRDFIHVDDVGRALVAMLDSELTGPINVGSGRGVAVREVVELIGKATERTDLLRIGEIAQAPGETQKIVADVRKLQRTGWSPSYDLAGGLEATVAWYRTRTNR